jgi:hypothetical protein
MSSGSFAVLRTNEYAVADAKMQGGTKVYVQNTNIDSFTLIRTLIFVNYIKHIKDNQLFIWDTQII